MKSWIKKSLLVFSSTCVGISIIVLPFLFFIKPANDFVFGNFNSYISEDVRKDLTNEYNIKWQYYASNAQIPTFIQNKTLDIAIATNNTIGKLIDENLLKPIPWDKFQITKDDGTTVKSYLDLKNIVTPAVWNICEIIAQNIDGVDNILEYTVPYFMQNFVFSYRGKQIEKLNENSNFKEIFDFISNDAEFTSKFSNVMMIEDARSIYDVSRLIDENSDINPIEGLDTSISKINSSFDNIANYYSASNKKNILTFNADSSIVLNKIALNQSKGAFMYNGDAIYAALGGDNPSTSPNLPNFENDPDFHVIVPANTFYALDGIVINKDISDVKMKKAINIINQLCLSGLSAGENISEYDNKIDDYKYMSTRNFNFVNYTPCYSKLYDYTIDDTENGYFSQQEIENPNELKTLINLIKINADIINKKNIELPRSDEFNSNLNIAFTTFKNKL